MPFFCWVDFPQFYLKSVRKLHQQTANALNTLIVALAVSTGFEAILSSNLKKKSTNIQFFYTLGEALAQISYLILVGGSQTQGTPTLYTLLPLPSFHFESKKFLRLKDTKEHMQYICARLFSKCIKTNEKLLFRETL